jgi:hypothetical protein
MTGWTAAMLTAVWYAGGGALSGEPAAAVYLLVWLAAAGFALLSAARRLEARLLGGKAPPRPNRRHTWDDGFVPPSAGDRDQ